MNIEIESVLFEKSCFTEADYQFKIQPNFSTQGIIIEVSRQEPLISCIPDDSIRDLLVFNATTKCEECIQSRNPVDILSFDSIFPEYKSAPGLLSKGRRFGIFHNFTMDEDPRYKYVEIFGQGVKSYVLESKDFFSRIIFKLKNENSEIVSINGRSKKFRLSNKELSFLLKGYFFLDTFYPVKDKNVDKSRICS